MRHLVDTQQLQDREAACRNHAAKTGRSLISPIPQLRAVGIENKGRGRRPGAVQRAPRQRHDPSRAHSIVEDRRLREQTQDQERLVREVEEETRMDQDATFGQQRDHKSSRSTSTGRAARRTIRPQPPQLHGRIRRSQSSQARVVRADPLEDLVTHLRAACNQGARRSARVSTRRGRCRRSIPAAPVPPRRDRQTVNRIQPSFTCGRPADFERPPR